MEIGKIQKLNNLDDGIKMLTGKITVSDNALCAINFFSDGHCIRQESRDAILEVIKVDAGLLDLIVLKAKNKLQAERQALVNVIKKECESL